MKVLLVTTDIDHIEPYQYVGLKNKGVEITAICDQNAVNYEVLTNADIHVDLIPFNARKDKSAIAFIRERVNMFNPDIVHVLRKKALSNTIPALNNSDAKLVAYRGIVGNLSFFDPISRMTFLNPRVDKIVCVAEAIRQHFINMGFWWVKLDPQKLVTIHKGHLTEKYSDIDSIDLSKYGVPVGNLVVACTASMRPRKGVDVLIGAFSQLSVDNVTLLLVGDIKDKKIKQAIEKSPKKEKILVIGKVPQSEALSIAGSVDVITMPSTKREGLPRALIEAMAQSTPAVVTNVGGSPELVEDGVSGYVVPPKDVNAFAEALSNILEDKQRLEKMGQAAKQRINNNFHVKQTVEKNWTLYNELLSKEV